MTDTETLNAIRSLLSGELTAAPSWLDNPGAPVVPGTTCYDNVPEAKRYAAQGFNASGVQMNAPQDLPAAIERARKLVAATSPAEREAVIQGAGALDNDTAAVAALTGYALAGSLGGTPYLMLGPVSLAYLIKAPGPHGTPGIA